MAIYAIGDLQGCCDPLEQLLDAIRFNPRSDQLWFVGDLVNRGPDSLRTLRTVKALGPAAVTVLGNHDLHLLAASIGVRKPSASDTLDEILAAPDAGELLDWIRTRKLVHHADGRLLVHAGILPQWNVWSTLRYAAEVERELRGPNWQNFLAHLFGNQPDCWDESLSGFDRLRVIVNACTRLRFCTPEGQMEFSSKEGTDAAPIGYLPWFDVPGRQSEKTTVIFGHWSTLGLVMRPNLLALDTGCVWGGKLTAVRLEDRALFQVECAQYRHPG